MESKACLSLPRSQMQEGPLSHGVGQLNIFLLYIIGLNVFYKDESRAGIVSHNRVFSTTEQ